MNLKAIQGADRWAMLGAFAFIVITANNGLTLYRSVNNITNRQQTITDNLKRWIASYRALQPLDVEWREKLKSSAGLDLLALYKAIEPESAGLESSPDMMLVDKIDRVNITGVEPGASNVYVITAGRPGFVVTAKTWPELIGGLDKLAARSDIRFQAITMEANHDDDPPTAIIHGLAIVLRDEETKK
jgi:hypothetical protein